MISGQPIEAIDIDHPIKDASGDTLQRTELAESFARRVLALPASRGLVIGVFGPWGSGKTSFINLARPAFQVHDIPVLDFNPWMFSGTKQLVERFFAELSAQLKLHNLEESGKALEDYANVLTGRLGMLLKLAGVFARRRSGGVSGHRKKIEQTLAKQEKPIIVVVDDVDRLSGPETRDIFKLVRLTASFPNMIYIVACDRKRVEEALDDDGVLGSDYLGKIIQLPFDLPEIPRQLFKEQVLESIQIALDSIENPGPFHERESPDVIEEIIRPLIRNIRDLRRYCVSIQGTADSLKGAVACVDMLALEAIRLFLPEVFLRLPHAIQDLTVSPGAEQIRKDFEGSFYSAMDRTDTDTLPSNSRIDEMIERGESQKDVVLALIRRLFPQGAQYLPGATGDSAFTPSKMLQERRVGHELVLRLYLERVADQDLLDTYDAEQAYARMADRNALEEFLDSRDSARLPNVIYHLSRYESEFQPDQAAPGIIALLNLLPVLPRQSVPLLDEAQRIVGSIVVSLFRTLDQGTVRERTLDSILPELISLSAKVTLIDRIGFRPNVGRKLISKNTAERFDDALTKEIRATPPDALAEERNPALILSFAQQGTREYDHPFTVPDDPKLTFALLQDCQTLVTHATFEVPSRTRQTAGLSWRNLLTLYGSNAYLKQCVSNLVSRFDELKPWINARMSSIEEAERLLKRANNYLRKLDKE